MTVISLQPYRVAVEREICGPCPDRNPHGGCGRDPDTPCTIRSNFGPLVEAVLSVGGSPDVNDYVKALRSRVCPGCRQDDRGECDWREHCGCKLDGMLIEVIDVIEAVHDEQKSSAA